MWYMDSFAKLFGQGGSGKNGPSTSSPGHIHKYLRNLVLNQVGVEAIRERILPDMEEMSRKALLAWSNRDSFDVKNATSSVWFIALTLKQAFMMARFNFIDWSYRFFFTVHIRFHCKTSVRLQPGEVWRQENEREVHLLPPGSHVIPVERSGNHFLQVLASKNNYSRYAEMTSNGKNRVLQKIWAEWIDLLIFLFNQFHVFTLTEYGSTVICQFFLLRGVALQITSGSKPLHYDNLSQFVSRPRRRV